MPRLEAGETAERMQGDILHQVAGVQLTPRGLRKPAVRPSAQRREMPPHQRIDGRAFSLPGPGHEIERVFNRVIIRRISARPRWGLD
jgi:hypothetical protein